MPVSMTWISASSPRRRTPTRMRPLRVYLMALETRFWISRRSRLRSVRHASATTARWSARASSRAAIGWKSVPIWRSSPSSRNTVSAGFIAPASSREMSSTAPRMVSTDSSEDSMLSRRLAGRALAGLFDQRRAVEPGGVERLQDVVAGGGEEARLAEIGLLGQHLRLRQLLVDAGQFGGAALDALLQRFVGALQRKIRPRPAPDMSA